MSLEITLLRVSEVRPYEFNARLNDDTVKALEKAIRKYGFNQPIVVDGDGVIIKGHARYQAAVNLGMEEIPAIVSGAADDVNAADRLADNMIHDLSGWDDEALRGETRDISGALDEILGRLFSEEDDYAPGVESRPVDMGQVEKARETQAAQRNAKPVLLKMVCPDCGEVMYLDKKTVERA